MSDALCPGEEGRGGRRRRQGKKGKTEPCDAQRAELKGGEKTSGPFWRRQDHQQKTERDSVDRVMVLFTSPLLLKKIVVGSRGKSLRRRFSPCFHKVLLLRRSAFSRQVDIQNLGTEKEKSQLWVSARRDVTRASPSAAGRVVL